ncbi:hypothetical protein HON22_04285 [Candidatus Peregrinibacteria bacterium]|jgi:hypothetical protein|nr:hypothetical protein [Candidatus Peregrinibacteria bacterium]
MSQETADPLDIKELYNSCISRFWKYEKKAHSINFAKNKTNLEKEKRRILAFKTVISSYIDNSHFKKIIPDYEILLGVLLENINTALDLRNNESFRGYNLALNLAAYYITSFKYEIHIQYLKYLQIEYPNQFYEVIFLMKNQASGIKTFEEKEKLEQKIRKLEEIINIFSKNIYNIKNLEYILQNKKKMDIIFNEIQNRKRNKFDKAFPNSIGNLRESLSDGQNSLHQNTSKILDNFSNISMEFETDYFTFIEIQLQNFLRKIH